MIRTQRNLFVSDLHLEDTLPSESDDCYLQETTMMMTLRAEAEDGDSKIMEENCQLIRASTMNFRFPSVMPQKYHGKDLVLRLFDLAQVRDPVWSSSDVSWKKRKKHMVFDFSVLKIT